LIKIKDIIREQRNYEMIGVIQKEGSMKRMYSLFGFALVVVIAVSVMSGQLASAQDPLKMGTILQRTELAGAKGLEAILVLREVPPGGESGKHTQKENEVVYVLEGSITVEIQGKPPVTLKTGEAFTTGPGEVHNVKNASTTAPAKALAFYIAKKGAKLEDLSLPVK
jgi:quercetin dioxygenase-like cupin family protein